MAMTVSPSSRHANEAQRSLAALKSNGWTAKLTLLGQVRASTDNVQSKGSLSIPPAI
jgi:hypothetical protein